MVYNGPGIVIGEKRRIRSLRGCFGFEKKGILSQPTYLFTTPQEALLPYFAFMAGIDSTGSLNCETLTCRVEPKEVENLVLTQSFIKKSIKKGSLGGTVA